MDSGEKLALLGLSHVEFLRPREKLALVEMLGGAGRIFELSLRDIGALLGRRPVTTRWDPREILGLAAETAERLTADGMGSIFYWDAAYPPLLREIYDPPIALFWRGALPRVDELLAGIVGTRLPTGAARKAAFRMAFELACEGVGTVSGLARGIDSEAHAGCIAARGYTIAVLGSGTDVVSPASSWTTARALLEGGGTILSEYPPGTPPAKHHFPARNRIISGLSRSVVVVQAPERSGALITAEYALEQGRDLFVHAAGIAGSAGAGTRSLADAGAPVVAGSAELLSDWGREPHAGHLPPGADHADGMQAATPAVGLALARRLREEIEGSCALSGGETYWRG
jgi:DNA processing protein